MLTAIFWSALATGTILIGMALAYRNLVGQRWTGLIMAFGAGANGIESLTHLPSKSEEWETTQTAGFLCLHKWPTLVIINLRGNLPCLPLLSQPDPWNQVSQWNPSLNLRRQNPPSGPHPRRMNLLAGGS